MSDTNDRAIDTMWIECIVPHDATKDNICDESTMSITRPSHERKVPPKDWADIPTFVKNDMAEEIEIFLGGVHEDANILYKRLGVLSNGNAVYECKLSNKNSIDFTHYVIYNSTNPESSTIKKNKPNNIKVPSSEVNSQNMSSSAPDLFVGHEDTSNCCPSTPPIPTLQR